MTWRAEMFRWMTLEAAALKPDTDVSVHPETCHSSDAGPRPRLATNCTARNQEVSQAVSRLIFTVNSKL